MAESAAQATDVELPVRKGDVIGGKYRVEDVLGIGGTAVVVSATHLALHQRVALKLLLPTMLKQGVDHLDRLVREARVIAQMRSPHVARVSDVGMLDNGAPFMVMELLDGMDLETHIEMRGALPVAEAVDYIMQICEAVAEAHSLGVVHRDLKPGNVFLTTDVDRRPLVKVLDFGLSKLAVGHAPRKRSITQPLEIMGTPTYMSPEQLRATRDVDERSDIWSLGVILYELVSGKPPFEDESVQDLCAKIIRDPPTPLELPDLPPGFEAIVMRCLEKEAADRYPRVSALASALAPYSEKKERLERVLRVQPLDGTPPPPDSASFSFVPSLASAPTQAGVVTETDIEAPIRPRRRGWSLLAFGIAGALTGTAVLAGLSFYADRAARATPPSAGVASVGSAPPSASASASTGASSPEGTVEPGDDETSPAPRSLGTATAATDPAGVATTPAVAATTPGAGPPTGAASAKGGASGPRSKPGGAAKRAPGSPRPPAPRASGTTPPASPSEPPEPVDPDKLLETR